MENEDNKSIFTFDPGDPPEDYIPDDPGSGDDVVFDWDPADFDSDADIDDESDEEYDDDDSDISFWDRLVDKVSSIDWKNLWRKLPSVDWNRLKERLKSADLKRLKVAAPSVKMSMKTRYLIRRVAALLILLAVLIPSVWLITKTIRDRKPVTTENVGPLPGNDVTIHRVPVYYDYSKPVPETSQNSAFFTDALIVGDTRLVQLLPTYGIGTFEKILYGTAVNVSNALEYDNVNAQGDPETLASALRSKPYGKIYICLGLNELGWSYPDVFETDYRTLVQNIRSAQPNAQIYLLAIVPVNESDFSNDYIYNSRIREYNEMILSVARSFSVFYVDCYTGMSDGNGSLNPAYTSNGFYINADGAEAWWKYISSHTVDPEDYDDL